MGAKLTLAVTAQRLAQGTLPQIALKEHIDEWNRTFNPELFEQEPALTGQDYLDAWLAAMAEHEADMLGMACPDWAIEPCRFLREPLYFCGPRSREVLANETPVEWSRRGLYPGASWMKRPEKDFIGMVLSNVNTSYKTIMSVPDLVNFMLTGKVQPGLEGQVLHLIDETPTSLVVGAIEQIAEKRNVETKIIWMNLARVAAEIKSPNKFWVHRER